MFRNQTLDDGDNGMARAMAHYHLASGVKLVDLNDPNVLRELHLKPSEVATMERSMTQALSRRLHEKNSAGFTWWSSLEASWVNVTLFQSRVRDRMKLTDKIRPLSIRMKEVQEAARWMKVRLKG